MTEIVITEESCIGCGACTRDCLQALLIMENGRPTLKEGFCIQCGHCVAVCPTDAIRLSGCREEEIKPYIPAEFDISPSTLLYFMKYRRSVRQFYSRPIEPEKISMMLEAARYSPTGGNQQMNRYILLEQKKDQVIDLTLQTLYNTLQQAAEVPDLQWLKPYQGLCTAMHRAWQTHREDRLFYGAPCILLTIARQPKSASGYMDGALASANLELMAHALGLGACYVGFVGIAASLEPELRKVLGLRKKEKLISTLAIGYPAVRYFRTVNRHEADLTLL